MNENSQEYQRSCQIWTEMNVKPRSGSANSSLDADAWGDRTIVDQPGLRDNLTHRDGCAERFPSIALSC